MKLKELIKIYKQLKGKSGCIVITKDRGGALAVRYVDFIKKHIGLGCIIHPNSSEAKELFNIFPELKESEDERIFEEIYKDLHTYYMMQRDKFVLTDIKEIWDDKWSKAKAWLEKQGKNIIGISESTKQKLEDSLNKALEKETPESWNEFLDKKGEQKSAEKVEPKFHKGDWVMLDRPVLITKVEDMSYNTHQYWTSDGAWFGDATKAKLWTIQDANDGDVLCNYCEEYDNPLIFILKKFERVDFGLVKPSDYSSYCFLTAGDRQIFKEGKYHHKHNIKPATKEQRELLFQKMKEAGYEWDTEKKELKKIEQKPAKWSEEDRRIFSNINLYIRKAGDYPHFDKENIEEAINWLKSLKDRYAWKPSDEQMEALKQAKTDACGKPYFNALASLYVNLKGY